MAWTAAPVPIWEETGRPEGGEYWEGIAYGNGRFVAVSVAAHILVSTDGKAWTQAEIPRDRSWIAVAYGNGLFVAVQSGFTRTFTTSPDGITWTLRDMTFDSFPWSGIAFGGGRFVACGTFGAISTSPDGITWTQVAPSSFRNWLEVAYGNGVFMLMAGSSSVVATSPDGVNWTEHATPAPAPSVWLNVAFGAGVFLLASDGYGTPGAICATSPDGVTWIVGSMPAIAPIVPSGPADVTFGDKVFVTVGNAWFQRGAAPSTTSFTSPDGINWTEAPLSQAGNWAQIAFGGGTFVALPWDEHYVSVSGEAPPHYLRMNQRDDGLGIARSPRLAGTSNNGPTSLQRGKPPRLGLNNTYR